MSISQRASAVRSGGGVLSGIRGLEQPPTSCLWQLTREQASVHPEWLFQPPHLDARTELEQKWIDSLFHSQFINSEGLEVQWPRSFNYFSAGRVTITAKVLIPIQGQSYDTLFLFIWSCARQGCLRKCYSLVVPYHVIRVNVRGPHQFSNKDSDVIGKGNQNFTAMRKCLF